MTIFSDKNPFSFCQFDFCENFIRRIGHFIYIVKIVEIDLNWDVEPEEQSEVKVKNLQTFRKNLHNFLFTKHFHFYIFCDKTFFRINEQISNINKNRFYTKSSIRNLAAERNDIEMVMGVVWEVLAEFKVYMIYDVDTFMWTWIELESSVMMSSSKFYFIKFKFISHHNILRL